VLEKRALHVIRDQRFVEIPDYGDLILDKQVAGPLHAYSQEELGVKGVATGDCPGGGFKRWQQLYRR
jgi:hypothetical protein